MSKFAQAVPAFTEPEEVRTQGVANLLSIKYSIRNGALTRADRLNEGQSIIVDNTVWEVVDAGFEDDQVWLRLCDLTSSQKIVCPRYRRFKTVYAVIVAN